MSGKTAEAATSEEEPAKPDLEPIFPQGTTLIVEGIECEVRRLKTREFLALSRILVMGLGPGLQQLFKAQDLTKDEIAGQLLGSVVFAIPLAAEEFISFVQLLVVPKKNKDQAALNRALKDPEIDSVLDVIDVVAQQEAEDLAGLVGKAGAVWNRMATLYRPLTQKTNGLRTDGTPARSLEPST